MLPHPGGGAPAVRWIRVLWIRAAVRARARRPDGACSTVACSTGPFDGACSTEAARASRPALLVGAPCAGVAGPGATGGARDGRRARRCGHTGCRSLFSAQRREGAVYHGPGVKALLASAGLLAASALLLAGCGGGAEGVDGARGCRRPRRPRAPSGRLAALANRIGADVYCPGWLPDPLTSQIGGQSNNIDSVSKDRSYLESFIWQDTDYARTSR